MNKKGYAAAAYLLGRMYESGDGVEQDAEKAAEWYARMEKLGMTVQAQ